MNIVFINLFMIDFWQAKCQMQHTIHLVLILNVMVINSKLLEEV